MKKWLDGEKIEAVNTTIISKIWGQTFWEILQKRHLKTVFVLFKFYGQSILNTIVIEKREAGEVKMKMQEKE